MEIPEIEKDVREIVGEVLETSPDEIDQNASFELELGMDSMMALEVLAGVELKYRIQVPDNMIPEFKTLNDTIRLVDDLLSKKDA